MVWIAGVAIVTGTYGLANLVFLNGLLDAPWSPRWQLWFLDVLVWTLVAVVALLSVPTMARWERRAPYGFALSVLGAGLAIRYLTSGIEADIPERYTIEAAAWFFTLGWAAAKTENVLQRLVLTGITLVAVPGFFGQPQREAVIVLGVVLLVWTTQLRVPQRLATIAGVLASSSLYVYLTHYQVYPHFEVRLLGVLASFAVGITYWRLATPMLGRLAKLTRHVAFSRRLVPRPRRGAPA
jgi:surface polysaccharide O-acyltransferase-like enzyme